MKNIFIGLNNQEKSVDSTPTNHNTIISEVGLKSIGKQIIIKECIITINQDRNIITTPIEGMDGTIKEYISDNDYDITLDIGVSNYDLYNTTSDIKYKEYPLDRVQELLEFLKLKESIEISSEFLALFDVHNIIVKRYTLTQETHTNRQFVNVQCLSEVAYEIKQKRF